MNDTSPQSVGWFIEQFKSGAQGCEMDCDDAQGFAEDLATLLAERDALQAQLAMWKLQSDDWQSRGWELGKQVDVLQAKLDVAMDAVWSINELSKLGGECGSIARAALAQLTKEDER